MSEPFTDMELSQWLRHGLHLHQAGRVADAAALYTRVLAARRNHFDALHLLGVCRHQEGDLAEAQRHLRAALKLRPDAAAAHLSYGNLLREMKRLPDAIESYERAVRLDPALALAHYNLGTAFEEMERPALALEHYDRAIQRGGGAAALNGRGNCLHALDRDDEAIDAYRAAIAGDGRHADAYANLGGVLVKKRRFEDALACVEQALSIEPRHPGANLNLVIALNELGRSADALVAAESVLATMPDSVGVLLQRARTLIRLHRYGEALAVLDRILAMQPGHWNARVERAGVLSNLGRADESERLFEQLLSERPRDAEVMHQRGLLCLFRGDLEGARRDIEFAVGSMGETPKALYGLSFLDLLEGRFEQGWARYEYRWDDSGMRHHRRSYPQPLWLGGQDISTQCILVHAEQGLGDTIQFCRYVPLLKARAAQVVFEVPPALFSLLRRSLPPEIVIVTTAANAPFGCHCPLMSLPLAFGTQLDTIPAAAAYLRADPQRVDTWRNRLGSAARMRIGIAWSGNPGHVRDKERSIPLREFLPLIRSASSLGEGGRIEFLALQSELRASDRDALAEAPALHYFGEAIEDFDDTAALIMLCDVVICVDTASAHLAAALGKPVWLLVSSVPDWRWLLQRVDSPWYPSVRLIRQRRRWQWSEEIARVSSDLAAFVGRDRDAIASVTPAGPMADKNHEAAAP